MYNNISIISDIIPEHNEYDAHFKLKSIQTSLYKEYPDLCKDIYIETVLQKQNDIYLFHTKDSDLIYDFFVENNSLNVKFIKEAIFSDINNLYEKVYYKLIHIKDDLSKIILYVPHSLMNIIKRRDLK